MEPKEIRTYQIHGHDGRYSFEGECRVIPPSLILGSADGPFCFWDMFIIGTDVQKYFRSSKISAEWLELRIHLDDRKVKTLQRIGLLDYSYSLGQRGNATIFETLNSTELQV